MLPYRIHLYRLRWLIPVHLLHQVRAHVFDVTIMLLGALELEIFSLDELLQIYVYYFFGILLTLADNIPPLLLAVRLNLHEVFLGDDEDGGVLARAHHRGLVRHVEDALGVAEEGAVVELAEAHFQRLFQGSPLFEHVVVALSCRDSLQ